MLDFQLLVNRLRRALASSQRRAHTMVSGQLSTQPVQFLGLRTKESRQAPWRLAPPLLGFAVAYLVAYVYWTVSPHPVAIWPPHAILLSALLLTSPRQWWLFVLITLPIRMVPTLGPGLPLWLLFTKWLNEALTALVAAALVRRFASHPFRFTTLSAMGVYLASAVFVVPFLSAVAAAASYVPLGIPFWWAVEIWFLQIALASLVLTPTIVIWATAGLPGLRPSSRQRALEALGLGAALLVAGGVLVFTQAALVVENGLYYLPLPLLVWAAVRFGPRGVATALTAVTGFAIADLAGLWGLVTPTWTSRDVLSVQLFLMATAVPLLLLAAQIEERKQAVEQMKLQAEELTRVFGAVDDGIAIYDRDGREMRTNAALQRLFRLDLAPPEYRRMSLQERMDLFAPRDTQGRRLAPNEMPLPRGLAGEVMAGAKSMDLRSRSFDGHDVEVNVSAAPLRDSTGQMVGVVCVFRDQTELNQLVREREEARASELALQETKAQMDAFLGIASHELKTPLTSLKLSLQWSQRQLRKLSQATTGAAAPGGTGVQAAMEQMERTAHQMLRMEALVNDLVDVSRIQAGKLELRPEPVDLVAIVHEAVAAQREAEPERGIYIEHLPELSVPVHADPGRIEQVVTNYLTNALKYSPVDRPVEVGIEIEPPQQLRVWVRDYGEGVPLSEQEHIWERFHRAVGVEVQTGTGVGLGLGLYISRMIIEHHQGQVGVESSAGQGATFWFTLPSSRLSDETT
jgi:signal transduction histidine kinase/integral membrane sensor domain MASE1